MPFHIYKPHITIPEFAICKIEFGRVLVKKGVRFKNIYGTKFIARENLRTLFDDIWKYLILFVSVWYYITPSNDTFYHFLAPYKTILQYCQAQPKPASQSPAKLRGTYTHPPTRNSSLYLFITYFCIVHDLFMNSIQHTPRIVVLAKATICSWLVHNLFNTFSQVFRIC